MPKKWTAGEFRTNLRQALDELSEWDSIVYRHGKPVAVMIPYRDYKLILAELVDARETRRVQKTYEEWKAGKESRDYSEVREELLNEVL